MPIDESRPWGEVVDAVQDMVTFDRESTLSGVLSEAGPRNVRMGGGDFVDVTGGPSNLAGRVRRYPCDVLHVAGGATPLFSIGTIELRKRRWRILGGFMIATNIGRRGSEVYSSRAHPNDGKFEVIDALNGLTPRELLTLSRRLSTGGDIGHPRVRQRQATNFLAPEPLHVFVDGVHRGRFTARIDIRADFLVVHV